MKKNWLLIPLLFALTACSTGSKAAPEEKGLKKVTVVLDYVPNTNHTGIYLAKEKGYYKDAGLDVKIIEPGDDSTSIGLVGANKAQFGVSYQEDVTYAHVDGQNIPVKAIGTIIKHNTSGFVSLKNSGINSPKDFEGKTYAGWQSPSEEAVLKATMNKEGADFSKLTIIGSNGEGPQSLGKEADIQWYFEGWDMIKANELGIDLNYMPLRELDKRLDYYTPLIITNDQMIKEDPDTVQAFMDATKKGYQEAMENPKEGAKILHNYASDYEQTFLDASQEFLSKNYTDDPAKWGMMDAKVWDNYTDFMKENCLIKEKISAKELFTNQFIE